MKKNVKKCEEMRRSVNNVTLLFPLTYNLKAFFHTFLHLYDSVFAEQIKKIIITWYRRVGKDDDLSRHRCFSELNKWIKNL